MEMELNEPAVAYNKITGIKEFLNYVETLENKYEFWDGALVMMAGTTQDHAEIRDNIHRFLKDSLKTKGCKSFQETIYLRIQNEEQYLFLPDVLVTCNPEDISGKSRFVESPSIIVEILSETTERYDRGEKWAHYRKIPSLKYYLLVSQTKPKVEVYGRPHAQSLFYLQDVEGLDAIIDLKILDIQIPMRDIYEGIVFETETSNP
jgi:Uma2 family endonuclease